MCIFRSFIFDVNIYSSIKIDGKSPVDFATFSPLHVYYNLHGYWRDESTQYIIVKIVGFQSTFGSIHLYSAKFRSYQLLHLNVLMDN